MKKFTLVFLAVLMVFLAGCATAGKKALRTQRDPIALVSVVSNADINWKGEKPVEVSETGPFARRTLRRDPDLTVISGADELIVEAEQLFRDTMAASGLIDLADKGTVLGAKAYQEAKLNRFQLTREKDDEQVKPGEYRYVDYRDKNFPPALAAETGIQRTLYLEFDFTKTMALGIGKYGSMQAELDLTVRIIDAQGKNLFKKKYSQGSEDRAKVTNGVYSHSDLMDLLEATIVDVCHIFLDDLAK